MKKNLLKHSYMTIKHNGLSTLQDFCSWSQIMMGKLILKYL